MLQEDSSEVIEDAADRLGPGTELKPLDNSQNSRHTDKHTEYELLRYKAFFLPSYEGRIYTKNNN